MRKITVGNIWCAYGKRAPVCAYACVLAAGFVVALLSGCIAIGPPRSEAVPGYGETYSIVDVSTGKAIDEGWLLLQSDFDTGLCRLRWYNIEDGVCVVPSTSEGRPIEEQAMWPHLLGGLYLYRVRWSTARRTRVYPVIPGFVPVSTGASFEAMCIDSEMSRAEGVMNIEVKPAVIGRELQYLERWYSEPFVPILGKKADVATHRRLNEYIAGRKNREQ